MRAATRFVRRVIADLRQGGRILVKEIAAFGVVGVINLVLNLAIYNLLTEGLGWAVVRSSIIATAISTTSAYFMNRYWSFSHRARTGLRREYTIFFGINGVGLVMESLIVAMVEYGLGKDDTFSRNLAKLTGIAVGTLFRFWAYKRWVFPPNGDTHRVPADGSANRTEQPPPAGARASD